MNTVHDCWVSNVQESGARGRGRGRELLVVPRRSFSSTNPVHVVESVAVSMVVDVPAADNAASTSPPNF